MHRFLQRVFVPARLSAPLLLAVLLASCFSESPYRPLPPPKPVSPNGEPLTGTTVCPDALAAWFDRTDGNRDGRIDLAEFKADAIRWFTVMDLDQDGGITAFELATVRRRIDPEHDAPIAAPLPRSRNEREEDRRGDRFDPSRSRQGTPPLRPADPRERRRDTAPDPVMQADMNLDFRVTRAEFEALALRRFAELDRSRRGFLDKADVNADCDRQQEDRR